MPDIFDALAAPEDDGQLETGPYDLEALQALQVSVFKADELRKRAKQELQEIHRRIRQNPSAQQFDDKGNLRLPNFQALARHYSQAMTRQGKLGGARLWEEIAKADSREFAEAQQAARDIAAQDLSLGDKLIEGGSQAVVDAYNVATLGLGNLASELVAEAIQDTGLMPRQFKGAEGVRRAREQMRDTLSRVGNVEAFGFDINVGEKASEVAGLFGFIGAAGSLQRIGTAKLAKLAEAGGKGTGLSQAGLAFVTGMTPKAARALVAGGKQGFGGRIVSSAANFGAATGLHGLVESANEAAVALAQGGDANQVLAAFAARARPLASEYLQGVMSGATMPFLQGVGHQVERSFGNVFGALGVDKRRILGATVRDLFGTLGPVRAARAIGARTAARVVGGGVEFLGFGLLPHLDPDNQIHFDTFTSLLSDDPKKRLAAMQGLFGHAINGMFVKGAQAAKMLRQGKAPGISDEAPRIDWLRYFLVDAGLKERPLPALPEGELPASEQVLGAKAAEFAAREGLLLPTGSQRAVVETVRIVADALEALSKNNPEQAELIAYELAQALAAEGTLASRLMRGVAGDKVSIEKLPDFALGEFRRRIKERAETQRLKDDVEENLANTIDELTNAMARLGVLPGMEASDPQTAALVKQIETRKAQLKAMEGSLANPARAALRQEIEVLQESLRERQQLLFDTGEDARREFAEARQRYVDAAFERVKQLVKEDAKLQKVQRERARGEDVTKLFDLGPEVEAAAEGAVPEPAKPKKKRTKVEKKRDKAEKAQEPAPGLAISDITPLLSRFPEGLSDPWRNRLLLEARRAMEQGLSSPAAARRAVNIVETLMSQGKGPGDSLGDEGPGPAVPRPDKPKPPAPAAPGELPLAPAPTPAQEASARRAAAKAKADEAQAAFEKEGPGPKPEKRLSSLLRLRAEEFEGNRNAVEAFLKAADILDGIDNLPELLRTQGVGGLRRLGIGANMATRIRDLVGVQYEPPAPAPAAEKPKSEKPPKITLKKKEPEAAPPRAPEPRRGPATELADAFRAEGIDVPADKEGRLLRNFEGRTDEGIADVLRKSGIDDERAARLFDAIKRALKQPLPSVAEEAEEVLPKPEPPPSDETPAQAFLRRVQPQDPTQLTTAQLRKELERLSEAEGPTGGAPGMDTPAGEEYFALLAAERARRQIEALRARGRTVEQLIKGAANSPFVLALDKSGEATELFDPLSETTLRRDADPEQVAAFFREAIEANAAAMATARRRLLAAVREMSGIEIADSPDALRNIVTALTETREPEPAPPKEVPGPATVLPPDSPTPEKPVVIVTPEKAEKIVRAIETRALLDSRDLSKVEDLAARERDAALAANALENAAQNRPDSPERDDLLDKAMKLRTRARWYRAEQRSREERVELDQRNDVPRYDETGRELNNKGEIALSKFRDRSPEELFQSLQDAIDRDPMLGDAVRQNLALIEEGVRRARDIQEADTVRGLNLGPIRYGDRVAIRTPNETVTGLVVTAPELELGDTPGRRVTLWDGERARRVRLTDIVEWSPLTQQDVDTTVGIRDGVYRTGAEVTNAQFQLLLTPGEGRRPPEPNPKGGPGTPAERKRQRDALRRGEGTVEDARDQAEIRARRFKITVTEQDESRVDPADWHLMAQAYLVPPETRRRFYHSAKDTGVRYAKDVVKALNAKEEGKPLTKAQEQLLEQLTPADRSALEFFSELYFDPKVKPTRTIKELMESTDPADKADQEGLARVLARAEAADKIARESYATREDLKDRESFLVAIAETPNKDEAILQRRTYNERRGTWGKVPGKGEFIRATYQPDTGTWLLRDFSRGEAIDFVRKNFDPNAESIGRWAEQQRRMGELLENNRPVLDVVDKQAALERAFEEALDLLRRHAAGEPDVREEFSVFDMRSEGREQAEESRVGGLTRAQRVFQDTFLDPLNKWLRENPRPSTDPVALREWEIRLEQFLDAGPKSYAGAMRLRVENGKHPVNNWDVERGEDGQWIVKPPKGIDPLRLAGGFFPFGGIDVPRAIGSMARDLTGMVGRTAQMVKDLRRRYGFIPGVAYGFLQGAVADATHSAFSTLVTQPMAKLSRTVISIFTGGKDSADTVFGHSREANYLMTEHNRHLARMDLIRREADELAREFRSKYSRDELIALIRAEHEGKKPPALNRFRALMDRAATLAKDLGLAGEKFDEKWSGRYVRFGRWKWSDPDQLRLAMVDRRMRVNELSEELREAREALNKRGGLAEPAEVAHLSQLQNTLVRMKNAARDLRKMWLQAQLGWSFWSSAPRVRSHPLEIVDTGAIRAWESASRERRIEDWDEAVKKGLDLDRPELLLWDSVITQFQAIEAAQWYKRIAEDPRMSKDVRVAPKDWIVLTQEDLASSFAMRQLAGKAVNPWLYHYIKISEGPNGVMERIVHDLHASAKMALTVMAPANWALQTIANPLMVATKSGTSLFKAYPAYTKALFDVLFRSKQLEREFGPERWLDVATDADREFIEFIRRNNPDVDTQTVMRVVSDAIRAFGEGNWGGGLKGAAKALGLSTKRSLQAISFIYRRLDGAARVANYRLLREQGWDRQRAVEEVNQGWDLLHVNRYGDVIRKGVLQIPGTSIRIPLPFLANSFGSVPMIFMRNLGQIVGKSPLLAAEAALYIGAYNMGVAALNGLSDDDVDRIQRASVPNTNDLIHYIRSKLTPLTPDGTKAIDLWGFSPLSGALQALPGAESAFWGAAEGLKTGPVGAIEGSIEGRGPYGHTATQELLHSMLGGNHVLIGPWADFALDRDTEGQRVQWRYEAPGLWGTRGAMRLAVEQGHLPMAATYLLARLGGASSAFRGELAGLVGSVFHVAREFDRTDVGGHPAFELIADGEDIFDVKPISWEDALLRRLGFRLRAPNALRRFVERAQRQPGLEKDDRTGDLRLTDDAPPALRGQLARIAKIGNTLRNVESGAYLWGMLRHYARTKNESVLAEIQRRWSSAESRRDSARALVMMGMTAEAAEAIRLLGEFGLLTPETRIPRPRPDEIQGAVRGD